MEFLLMGISSLMEDLVNLKYWDYYVTASIILLGLIVAFRSYRNRASGDSGYNNGGSWFLDGSDNNSGGGF